MTTIDFTRLPKDGRRFEAMVCELFRSMAFPIIEEPATGVDGGRDILIERVTRDALGEKRERVVVQCKHFAHSGRAVAEGNVGVWQNAMVRSQAQGYLPVSSTTVTENLNRSFVEFSQANAPKFATFWSGEKLETLLNEHILVRDTFFPPGPPTITKDLGTYGWGAIFPKNADPSMYANLAPLLTLRRTQVESTDGPGIYREFIGDDGVAPGETSLQWLARHGVGPGTPNRTRVPLFLLLVGGPEAISFDFQAYLEVQYYVGRLAFDDASDLGRYAQAVCEAEISGLTAPRTAVFFAPETDLATKRTGTELVAELVKTLGEKQDGWLIDFVRSEHATKDRLGVTLTKVNESSLLFAASHGLAFPPDDPRQVALQGAVLTNDWPGVGSSVAEHHFFSAADLPADSDLRRKIIFFLGCYGAGTSQEDEYARIETGETRPLAARPFVAALPQKLLASGALAVIGHVGRAWTMSFSWLEAGPQPHTFRAVLESLMDGEPVGVAVQALSKRYAELASVVASIDGDFDRSQEDSVQHLNRLRVAMLDAKYYLVLGDPYARLILE